MIKGTKYNLIEDLENARENLIDGEFEEDDVLVKQVDDIIIKAKKGDYHDFESELDTPFPKMELHKDLTNAGLIEIDRKMQNGEYDDDVFQKEDETN